MYVYIIYVYLLLLYIFAKATNSFTYVVPSTCFPKTNIENISKGIKGIALHLRRTYDSDSKFEKRSAEYQKYLIARDYKPRNEKMHFSDVRDISREEARRLKIKSNFSTTCNLITEYNAMLSDIKAILK